MQSRDFCFWLQGFFEMTQDTADNLSLNSTQVKLIKEHLDLVFRHDTEPVQSPSVNTTGPSNPDWFKDVKLPPVNTGVYC